MFNLEHINLGRSVGSRAIALAVAFCLASMVILTSTSALADGGSGSGGSGSGSGGSGSNSGSGNSGKGGGDNGKGSARDAVSRGDALPISRILAAVRQGHPGDVVGVNLHRSGSSWVYDVKVLGQSGLVIVVRVDARSAATLSERGS